MGSYFTIERIIAIKGLRKLFVGNVFSSFFEGVLYGLVILLIEILMKAIYSDVGIAFYFISFIVMVSMKKIRVASYALVPSMLFVFISGDITSNTFMLISIVFVFAMLTIILEFSIKKFNYQLVLYPIMMVLAFSTLLISVYVFNRSTYKDIGYIFYTIIGTILVQFLAVYALKTSASANVLHKSVNYSYSTFYRASFIEEVVGSFIKENATERAVYGLFKLDIDEKLKKGMKKEVLESSLDSIKDVFPKNAILFHVEDRKYGFFIPWKNNIDIQEVKNENTFENRASSSSLKKLSDLLKTSSKEIKLSTGKKTFIEVKAGISIYGLQSNSLSELHRNATFASQYLVNDSNNRFIIFDPAEYIKRVMESKKLKELEDLIELNDIELIRTSLVGKNSKSRLTIVVPRQKSDEGYVGTLFEYIESAGKTEVFNRFIAAETTKNIGKEIRKIAVPHSWYFFGDDFDINKFINRLKIIGVNINQIVINFDCDTINKDKKILNNLEKLSRFGFKILLSNYSALKNEEIILLNPDYIIVNDAKNISIKIRAKICVVNIKDENSLINAYDNGADLFGGPLFNNENDEKIENINIINTIKKFKGEKND